MNPTNQRNSPFLRPPVSPLDPSAINMPYTLLPAAPVVSMHAQVASAPVEDSNESERKNNPHSTSNPTEDSQPLKLKDEIHQLQMALLSLGEQFRESQEEFEHYKFTHPNMNINPNENRASILIPPSVNIPSASLNALSGQMKARITPPAVFYGKPYIMGSNDLTVDEWMEYVERYMDVTGVGEAARCDFAMFYLGGAALSLMQGHRMNKLTSAATGTATEIGFWTWNWLKDKLRKQYQPFNKAQVIRDQLNRLRQGNDSVNGYLQAFIQLAGQIGNYSQLTPDGLSDNEKLAYFRRGLNVNLGLEIDKADGVMTYERATGFAAKIESAVSSMANSKGHAFSNTLGKPTVMSKGKFSPSSSSQASAGYGSGSGSSSAGPTAQIVTKLNELLNNAEGEADTREEGEGINLNAIFKKLSQEERSKMMKEGRCFFCREVGHITKNCPKRNKNYSKSGNQGKGEARHQ
jgi:hypothetical protein